MRSLARLSIIVALFGCAHVTKTRPTPKGAVDIEFAAGGPLANIPGLSVIPVPLSSAGVSIGVLDNLDVSTHLHLTSLALFGTVGLDVGTTWLAVRQDRGRPALTTTGRFYAFTNFTSGFTAYLETEATLNWRYARYFGSYASLDVLFQFTAAPLFTIGAGQELIFGRFALQLETRWYSPFTDSRAPVVNWVGLGGYGAFGVLLGLRVRLGGQP